MSKVFCPFRNEPYVEHFNGLNQIGRRVHLHAKKEMLDYLLGLTKKKPAPQRINLGGVTYFTDLNQFPWFDQLPDPEDDSYLDSGKSLDEVEKDFEQIVATFEAKAANENIEFGDRFLDLSSKFILASQRTASVMTWKHKKRQTNAWIELQEYLESDEYLNEPDPDFYHPFYTNVD